MLEWNFATASLQLSLGSLASSTIETSPQAKNNVLTFYRKRPECPTWYRQRWNGPRTLTVTPLQLKELPWVKKFNIACRRTEKSWSWGAADTSAKAERVSITSTLSSNCSMGVKSILSTAWIGVKELCTETCSALADGIGKWSIRVLRHLLWPGKGCPSD